MSQENVEIVLRHIEAFNRRDLKTWLALFRSAEKSTGRVPEARSRVSIAVTTDRRPSGTCG